MNTDTIELIYACAVLLLSSGLVFCVGYAFGHTIASLRQHIEIQRLNHCLDEARRALQGVSRRDEWVDNEYDFSDRL